MSPTAKLTHHVIAFMNYTWWERADSFFNKIPTWYGIALCVVLVQLEISRFG